MKTKLLYLTLSCMAVAPGLFAVEPTPAGKPPPTPHYTLAFSDDFATDPNSNSKWTIFRRQGDLNNEGYWDPGRQQWFLTRRRFNLATAAFANYELTAPVWKVNFKYHINNGPKGADGFVFMFYKDKSAYGTPDSGTYMAFQTRNSDGSDNPVPGYGLQFDTYQYGGCDPLQENYVAIVQNVICNSALVYRPYDIIDDDNWHSVEFTYNNGRCACTIDSIAVHGFFLANPDYTYTGIGFGAGTGSAASDQVIDDFQIWVAE